MPDFNDTHQAEGSFRICQRHALSFIALPEDLMAKPSLSRYTNPAGGWRALEVTGKALVEQHITLKGAATLLSVNQPAGFDCPGCAWSDPKHTSSFEFCENGTKAVA